jgi:hypothetical protein
MGTSGETKVRRLHFDFPARIDPMLVPGQPELSYALVSLSLLLPYVEPYLIRTMSRARHHVSDPALRAEVIAFNGQEGQHARQHERFNELIRAHYPALAPLEAELAREYRTFSAERGLRWSLAYASGFEAFTGALASFLYRTDLLRGMEPTVRDLFQWHMLEELEHRTVAFDVYEHLYGGYGFRLGVSTYAERHLCRFVARAMRVMLDADRAAGRDHGGGLRAGARVLPLLGRAARLLLPQIVGNYMPWFTPHAVAMPPGAEAALAAFMGEVVSVDAGSAAAPAPARPSDESAATGAPAAA